MKRYLVSYPKSGRSWPRYALHELRLERRIAFDHDTFEFNDGSCPPHNFNAAARIRRYRKCRVVYLERDPRDIMVSLYHQVTGRFRDIFGYENDLRAFLRDPYFGAHVLQNFRCMWDELCRDGIALKISYEACHADFVGVLTQVLDHYGFRRSHEDIARAADAAQFDKMKELEQSGAFRGAWLRPRNGYFKVRRGVAGGFRDLLNPEDIAYLDEVFELAPSGS